MADRETLKGRGQRISWQPEGAGESWRFLNPGNGQSWNMAANRGEGLRWQVAIIDICTPRIIARKKETCRVGQPCNRLDRGPIEHGDEELDHFFANVKFGQ